MSAGWTVNPHKKIKIIISDGTLFLPVAAMDVIAASLFLGTLTVCLNQTCAFVHDGVPRSYKLTKYVVEDACGKSPGVGNDTSCFMRSRVVLVTTYVFQENKTHIIGERSCTEYVLQ